MLSCHTQPFGEFCRDLQIAGTEVHLYRGPNQFGTLLGTTGPLPDWWETENTYFLAGVKPGVHKRAADSDVLKRGMFTLDFDIRKEVEKRSGKNVDNIEPYANEILEKLMTDSLWSQFRYVVFSGNGMHVHYFGEPAVITEGEGETYACFKEEWVAGMKEMFEQLNQHLPIPCDTGCGNAGRIMRMPGSWNVKGGGKRPVTIEVWNPDAKLEPLQFIVEKGRLALARQEERRAAERAEFAATHPDGGSDVIDLINQIPIEQVIAQLPLGCHMKNVKKDGGMRFVDEKGVERGFFRHAQYNIIVHEGTSLFPPPASGTGYNCLSLVKQILGVGAREAIDWFAERSSPVRMLRDEEHRKWVEAHRSADVELFESKHSHGQK